MRTYEEIKAEFETVRAVNDATAMRALAQELSAIGTPEALAMAEYSEGRCCLVLNDYAQALEHWGRALVMFEELGDRSGVSRTIGSMGSVYWSTGDDQQALEHFRRALVMHEELGDRNDIAIVTGNIGNVYYNTGEYSLALEQYERALAMHEVHGDRAGIARLTGNIGNVYTNTSCYPQALERYHRTVEMYEEIGDPKGATIFTCNLGSVYDTTGNRQLALECYDRALMLATDQGDRQGVVLVKNNLGIFYANGRDHLKALEYYEQALALSEELGDRASIAAITGSIVTSLLQLERDAEAARLLDIQSEMTLNNPIIKASHLGSRAKLAERSGDLDAAKVLLEQALSIMSATGVLSGAAGYHLRLKDLAQKRNDFAGYIEHNNEYNRITEETRGHAATQKMAVMEAERKMDVERRERDRERALLYSTLPKAVADRMLHGGATDEQFTDAAVLFLDVVGFTSHTATMLPSDVVNLLEHVFRSIDAMCEAQAVIKIKTIGDSYMCFRGDADAATNARSVAAVALGALSSAFTWPDGEPIRFRAGSHIGAATAGVIGTQRLQYDVWGDTVNVASRMESTGEAERFHVSEEFVVGMQSDEAVHNAWKAVLRGETEVKGKGIMTTYWLEEQRL